MKKTSNRYLIGMTGGLGSGKTTACKIVAERFPVLHSDEIARRIMATDPAVQAAILHRFGRDVFADSGELQRQKLAHVVFRDAAALEALNGIVHPVTIHEIRSESGRLFNTGHSMVFVESALIYESHIEDLFDYIVVITAEAEIVKKRLRAAGTVSEADWVERTRHQLASSDKAARADFTIYNNGGVEELRGRIDFVLMLLTSLCT